MDSKKYFTLLMLNLIAVLFCGCSKEGISTETRRQNAIQSIQEYHLSSKNPVMASSAKAALSSLQAATIETLKRPTISYAVLVEDTNQKCRLHLYWIEENPSVDGAELSYGTQTNLEELVMRQDSLDYNKAEAKKTVEFSFGYEWAAGSEFAKLTDGILPSKNLKIRLLRAKVPASDWLPVDFYKVDRWISGNTTTEK